MTPSRHLVHLTALLTSTVALAACTTNEPAGPSAPGPVTVSSTTTDCVLSAAQAPSGTVVFQVKNDGTEVTEFYLLAADGTRVVGEVEDIGPGLQRELVVHAEPGSYVAACKPGMVGDGIKVPFTVTDTGAQPAHS